METREIISKGPGETRRAAKILLNVLDGTRSGEVGSRVVQAAAVVGLYGDLGSGKTAFTQTFGELLGIKEKIASPTFVLQKIYKIVPFVGRFTHLVHIDAYRIESEKEMTMLGWRELLADPRNIILIEWPERIAGLMPPHHIRLNFEHIDETTRRITFAGE